MTRRRFKHAASRIERTWAQADVGYWGYPRPLTQEDYDQHTQWFRLGDDIVFWCTMTPTKDMIFHLCLSPSARQKPNGGDARRLLSAWNFIAETSGAKRIVADCTDVPKAQSYLARLGFTPAYDIAGASWMEVRLDEQAEDAEEGSEQGGAGRGEASGSRTLAPGTAA